MGPAESALSVKLGNKCVVVAMCYQWTTTEVYRANKRSRQCHVSQEVRGDTGALLRSQRIPKTPVPERGAVRIELHDEHVLVCRGRCSKRTQPKVDGSDHTSSDKETTCGICRETVYVTRARLLRPRDG